GRRRFTGPRWRDWNRCRDDQAGTSAAFHRWHIRGRSDLCNLAGWVVQVTQKADFQDGAAASSLRIAGLVRVENHRTLLDRISCIRIVRADHTEIEVRVKSEQLRAMELANKRVLVVGLGKSGVAAALFLKARGAQVTVSDVKPQYQLGEDIPVLLDHGITVETGGHGERTFRGQDLIVVS